VTLGADDATTTGAYDDVGGLTFSMSANTTYNFSCNIMYSADATATGSKWAMNGPASPTSVAYTASWASSAAGRVTYNSNTYDTAGVLFTSSAFTAGNIALIDGVIVNGANTGSAVVRFATETAGTITAKAGSTCEWW
jgi:hypothetical protein